MLVILHLRARVPNMRQIACDVGRIDLIHKAVFPCCALHCGMIYGMQIDLATGLIARVRQVLSPHFDARPSGTVPDLIVIHGISLPPGKFGGAFIDQLFTGNLDPERHPFFRETARLRVSSHVLIRRDGSIVQYVPFQARAWHAGESQYEGRAVCNNFSMGIELEGTDDLPYEDAQYEHSRISSARSSPPIRRSRASASWVTATSRPAARPIRAAPSTGRGCAAVSPSAPCRDRDATAPRRRSHAVRARARSRIADRTGDSNNS